MVKAIIRGTGSYLPRQKLTNHDLAARGVDTSDEWIASRTGIRNRRIATKESGADMAAAAAEVWSCLHRYTSMLRSIAVFPVAFI